MRLLTLLAWVALLGSSCSAPSLPPTQVVLDPIGPRMAGPRPAPHGYLRVYTDTRDVQSGKLPYQVHTSYQIYNDQGHQVRSVVNHVGDTDQAPMTVTLAPGSYRLLAEAAGYGRITAPVVIGGGMLTEVHLQRGGMPYWESAGNDELVRLPDGRVAGFRARNAPAKAVLK